MDTVLHRTPEKTGRRWDTKELGREKIMKKSIGPKTLVHPIPVFIVGTYDNAGKANVMRTAWGEICCSKPPCVAVSLRKARYSCDNLAERKDFTVNIAPEMQAY